MAKMTLIYEDEDKVLKYVVECLGSKADYSELTKNIYEVLDTLTEDLIADLF